MTERDPRRDIAVIYIVLAALCLAAWQLTRDAGMHIVSATMLGMAALCIWHGLIRPLFARRGSD